MIDVCAAFLNAHEGAAAKGRWHSVSTVLMGPPTCRSVLARASGLASQPEIKPAANPLASGYAPELAWVSASKQAKRPALNTRL